MISDECVRRIFKEGQVALAPYIKPNMEIQTQFFRGKSPVKWKNSHPGGCIRHVNVFKRFNVIPKYCFNCYKVLIEPRNVVELFKIMVIFQELELENDNTRKCMVEMRPSVSGNYKGYIYCSSVTEGKEVINVIQKVVSKEVSNKISISLKRGCSEFAASYPEYGQIISNSGSMEYREEWSEYEDLVDKELQIDVPDPGTVDDFHAPTYMPRDAQVMLAWLRYAATIGDTSYLEITHAPVHPFPNINRSFQFAAKKKSHVRSGPKISRNAPCICGSGKKYKNCCAG